MKKILLIVILLFQLLLYYPLTSVNAQTPTYSPIQTDALALCLSEKKWVMYGRAGCSACALEKKYFGNSFEMVNYVDCTGSPETGKLCNSKWITAFPTWEGVKAGESNGKISQFKGAIPLQILADLSGCSPEALSGERPTPGITKIKKAGIQITAIQIIPTQSVKTQILAENRSNTDWIKEFGGIFLAGLLSFFAPCVIPLFPTYLSLITGYTFSELYGLEFSTLRARIFKSALFFVLGFSIVFTLLGASVAIVGQFLNKVIPYFLKISGVLMIFLGLVELNIIKVPNIEFDFAWAAQRKKAKLGYISSGLMGIATALCWIPCIGPVLATILLVASNADSILMGALNLFVYSLGIMFPFLIGSLFFPKFFNFYREKRGYLRFFSIIAGTFIIGFGLILIFEKYGVFIDLYYSLINFRK